MVDVPRWFRDAAAGVMLVLLGAAPVLAQIAPPRTLDELKAETQARADRDAYPLGGLKPDNVREALSHINSLDRDEWAAAWSVIGQRYLTQAKAEEAAGKKPEAASDYLEAWRYYAFAHWPVENSPGKQKAAGLALDAFHHYAAALDPPLETVRIAYQGKEVVGYLQLPKGVRPAPVLLKIAGLDGRKEDGLLASQAFLHHGIGVLAFDMPGTGETPIKIDAGVERIYSAALDYLATRRDVDAQRVVVYGTSWGGYWAAKLGFAEAARLKGAVVQGGPVDAYFQPSWQKVALGTREYLFDLFAARAYVYGVASLDDFLAYGPRMSLKAQGDIGKPSAPMLLLNGVRDTQVPIADLDLLLHTGSPKEAWINPEGGHMGRSPQWREDKILAEIVLPWVERRVALAE